MLDAIIRCMEEIRKRGIHCTMSVESMKGGIRYASYIATGNETTPSHLKHENMREVLVRFDNYLKNNKAEVIKFLQDEMKRHNDNARRAQDKLVALVDYEIVEVKK